MAEALPVKSHVIKIAIIGVGSVGSTTGYALLLSGLASEIVLIDIDKRRAEGEAMDMSHAVLFSHPTRITAGDYADCKDASIVIVAAGKNQKPGQTRMDLAKINAGVFQAIIPEVVKHAPDCILLIATNPVDVLTYVSWKISGFPKERVIGSGTVLDTSRFRFNLARYYDVSPRNVHADIIGEHGDSSVPLWSLASISGMRLPDFCAATQKTFDQRKLDEIFQVTNRAAYEVIRLKGVTNYGVGGALVTIVKAILRDENTLLNVSTASDQLVTGQFSVSMPTIVNRNGAVSILPAVFSPEEKKDLLNSINRISESVDSLDLFEKWKSFGGDAGWNFAS